MTLFDPRVTPARPDLAAARLRGLVVADHYVEGHASHVCAGTADLRHAPAPDAPLDTQALFGEEVTLYEDHEGWGWVQLARDGYVGYMSMAALAEGPIRPTHRVTVNRSFVFPGPDLKLPPHDALPLGASVCVRATKAGFAQINDAAFVFSGHLMPSGENQKEFVAVAERLLYAPYLWGGKTAALASIALALCRFRSPRPGLTRRATPICRSKRSDCQSPSARTLRACGAAISSFGAGTLALCAMRPPCCTATPIICWLQASLCASRATDLAKTSQPISAIKRLEPA